MEHNWSNRHQTPKIRANRPDGGSFPPFFPPIYLQGIGSDSRPVGNIHFGSVTIKDDLNRPFIRIRDGKGIIPREIAGTIVLERKGRRENITVNEAWLMDISRSSKP